MGFPGGSDGKESACNVGDLGSIPGLGRFPGGGHGNPLQYSCLENPHGQRSLVGYSPWHHKELDRNERLSTAHVFFIVTSVPHKCKMSYTNGGCVQGDIGYFLYYASFFCFCFKLKLP